MGYPRLKVERPLGLPRIPTSCMHHVTIASRSIGRRRTDNAASPPALSIFEQLPVLDPTTPARRAQRPCVTWKNPRYAKMVMCKHAGE